MKIINNYSHIQCEIFEKRHQKELAITERLLAGDLHWQPGAPAVRPHGVDTGGGGHRQQPGPRLGPSPGPAPGLH